MTDNVSPRAAFAAVEWELATRNIRMIERFQTAMLPLRERLMLGGSTITHVALAGSAAWHMAAKRRAAS